MSIIYTWSAKGSGSGSGVATYPTFSAFPATAPDGTIALALDTDILYAFNATSTTWVIIGSPTSAAYTVNLFTLSPTDIANKFVTLSVTPTAPTLTAMTVVGGPMQSYSTDFILIGSQLNWSGLSLDGILTVGDKLIVQII